MPRAKDDRKINDIYMAAMNLVIQTGFNGLRMADVAKQAGIATGTLYIYFKDKKALINKVFIAVIKEMTHILLLPENTSSNFLETLRKRWDAYFKFCINNPEKMLFMDQFLYSGSLQKETIEQMQRIREPIYQPIRDAQQQLQVRNLDIQIIAAQLTGPIHEIIKRNILDKKPLDDELLNECFEMAWNSIRLEK